jgi:preprotein translocase subunit SecA
MARHYSILRKEELLAEKILTKVETMSEVTIDSLILITKQIKENIPEKTEEEIMIDSYANAYKAIQLIYDINLHKVQVMGAIALNSGNVAQMKTGEGKTLTAILPAYFNALYGTGVFVVTVNEYLSKRDGYNTGKVYSALGLTTGIINSEQDQMTKKIEYAKNVIYVTNSEIGFDYLRDNMVQMKSQKIQKDLGFAIIDEVDSILIDEARTPLIIAGGSMVKPEEYIITNDFSKELTENDYVIDDETKSIYMNDIGIQKAKVFFGLKNIFSFDNSLLLHRIQNSLIANFIYNYDVDYTVKNDEIVLIDIFTGRLLPGRSFSDGLNQALEAKENVTIKPETSILASITYQNFFRMFSKLAGMTGTASTEEEEFLKIYNMLVIEIPTNKPVIRIDLPDTLLKTKKLKFKYLVNLIRDINSTGQPILVGTRSVSDSEKLSDMLAEENIVHQILNAKNNALEADIIESAGEIGKITISTNMAGRGTDIKLANGVNELGGLYVIGSERNESRRIDEQLRGRSGRQGDNGVSRFVISIDDEVLLRAGLSKISKLLGDDPDSIVESNAVTKSVTTAQKRIEGVNFDQRKTVLDYDDVLNRQRKIVYAQRDFVLMNNDSIDTAMATLYSFMKDNLDNTIVYKDGSFDQLLYIN